MITRNRIKIPEEQAVLIWQQTLAKELRSADGQSIKVVYPGRINRDTGPDFRDAVIANRFRLSKGDVEVHVRSSDWYNHRHHTDATYNNVILHVAVWHDCASATLLQSGKSIPVLSLAEAFGQQAYLLPVTLPCSRILHNIDSRVLGKILDRAAQERFKQKAMYFQAEILRLRSTAIAPGQTLFRGIMRALGYSKNTKPFAELADRMPLNYIESVDGLLVKQALLLGAAGLLPCQRRDDEFARGKEVRELERIWRSAGASVPTMRESDWNFSHIYPNNSPVRRIVAQSYLLERYHQGQFLTGIVQLVTEASVPGGHRTLEKGLIVAGDGYWRDHFDFGIRSETKLSALLGNSKASEIMVNVVLPFAFSWGELSGQAEIAVKAMELYRSYPKLAKNEIIRHMEKQLCLADFTDFTARRQQGLIHIFRNYCREGRCSECPLAR